MNQHPDQTPATEPKYMADPDYRKKRRQKFRPFNFELSPQRREQLRAIADHRGISMGAALRQLVTTAYEMDIKKRPCCVTGSTCFMPHMHPQDQQHPPLKEPHP